MLEDKSGIGVQVPGDGLPFETAEQFGEWWPQHMEELFSVAIKKGMKDRLIAEPIVEDLVLEIIKDNLWKKYDPSLATAVTYFAGLLELRIIDYKRVFHPEFDHSFDVYQEGEGRLRSDHGEEAEVTLGKIDEHRAYLKAKEQLERELSSNEREVLILDSEGFTEREIMHKLSLPDRNRVAYLKRSGLKKLKEIPDLTALNPYGS